MIGTIIAKFFNLLNSTKYLKNLIKKFVRIIIDLSRRILFMKLNLGCGNKLLKGYINLDKFNYYKCDIIHDLEKFPYPFKNDSVNEILLSHVLEHIGQQPDTFINIIKELYRICSNNALIIISVPHPRHENFLSDPTHVRPITVLGLSLFDQKLNRDWQKIGAANSPLGLIHDVNFNIEKYEYLLDENIVSKRNIGELNDQELEKMMLHNNNVIKQININLRAIK